MSIYLIAGKSLDNNQIFRLLISAGSPEDLTVNFGTTYYESILVVEADNYQLGRDKILDKIETEDSLAWAKPYFAHENI